MPNKISTALYINGEERMTADRMPVANPAKPGLIVGDASIASIQDVTDAVAAAKAAYPAWAALTPQDRAEMMLSSLKDLEQNRDEDAAILSQENGKVRFECWVDSLGLEMRFKEALSHTDLVNEIKVLPPVSGVYPVETTVSFQPLGVVSLIVPFNWPLAILGTTLPYALLTGNTIIVKAPLTAPLATVRVIQRIAAQLPPGVINVLTGPDSNMTEIINGRHVAKVCFTGSVGGGKKMMELGSSNLTRVALELGGNDAAIILEDAILDDEHLDRLYHAIYATTGQICMNAKRLYVHRSRLNDVVEGLSERLEKVKLGYGLDEDTTMGPLHSPSQKAFVDQMVREIKAAGQRIMEFGTLPGGDMKGGNFVRPAIVLDPPKNSRVVQEEAFGPVVPIIPFDTEEEAIAEANNTWAGLCGSVWTASKETANRVGGRMECGYVWVNDHGPARLDLRAPFGGMKQSGIGRVQGIEAIRMFQDTRSIAHLDPEAMASVAS